MGEVGAEEFDVTLAHFAKHPADGFVYEVVRMSEEAGGKAEGVIILVVANEHAGRDNGDALLPEVGTCGKLVEDVTVGQRTIG